jgi:hypothetical protein
VPIDALSIAPPLTNCVRIHGKQLSIIGPYLRLSIPPPPLLTGSMLQSPYAADRGKHSRWHSIRQWLGSLLRIALSGPLSHELRIMIDFIRSSSSGQSASSMVCSVHVPRREAVASPNLIKWRQCPNVSDTISLLSFLVSTLASVIVPISSSEWLLVNTISGRRA